MAKIKKSTKVESTRHQDTRRNIPTEELRDFVSDDEKSPRPMLYPRDSSLDPQLVWRGKDEQDRAGLSVPIVPIYIQEKIHPQAIIEQVRQHAKQESNTGQLSLFADFNGIKFDDLVQFYQHEQHWSNRMILGDSLQVMTSLAEKEGLKSKVQMIYIDPPYGIKFGSNWQVSTRKRDVKDGSTSDVVRQPEQVKAFRDTWEYGVHSYLTYLRDRLTIARELLTESGSIFVQIGDENVHLVRNLLDEVFGSENFVSLINFRSMMPLASSHIESVYDYVIWYCKDKTDSAFKYRNIWIPKNIGGDSEFVFTATDDLSYRRLEEQEIIDIGKTVKTFRVFKRSDLASSGYTPSCTFPITFQGMVFNPVNGKSWRTNPVGIERVRIANRLFNLGNKLYFKMYHSDFEYKSLENSWSDTIAFEKKSYVVQTTSTIIQRCMLMTTDPGDLVLDPTCGSGSTAYVAEQWGRRWITIDTSRVALALARTRLMAARFPYYVLSDSPEGIMAEARLGNGLYSERETRQDIRQGFVYQRAPHVTLKTIATNQEIDDIYRRWQEMLEPLRATLNELLSKSWEEWEIPREAQQGWNEEIVALLRQYWQARRRRQAEIDESIARRAETEILYDKPIVDNSRVRVTGAFTVESLSPHRFVAADESVSIRMRDEASPSFEQVVIDNLRVAGVQNTFRDERIKFRSVDTYPGRFIQAIGLYDDAQGTEKRVAISIGPEYGTVSADDIKEAAKEAVRGIGFDVLIMCGFSFDPHVSEDAKQFGKLQVLITRMNSDLLFSEALLKKTGAGNLFTVFGEPDIQIQKERDGKLRVSVRGLDIFDPMTGAIRSSSIDDIACWFIDTDYNDESFFVRHAYFTGGNDPYEQLRKTLRAEIDESAWSALYSDESMPFERPKRGKIAVKVINHYGDEVLKVCEV